MKDRVGILNFLFICFFMPTGLIALPGTDVPDGELLSKPQKIGHRRTGANFQAELAKLRRLAANKQAKESLQLFEKIERGPREQRLVERFDEKRPSVTPMHSPRGKRVEFETPEEVYCLKLLELKKEIETRGGHEDSE